MSKKLVAVYGSLRRGMGNHRLLEGCGDPVMDTLTGYDMVSCGGFPAIASGEGTVVVELYSVDATVEQRLDWLEGIDEEDPQQGHYFKEEVTTDSGNKVCIYTFNHCGLGGYGEDRKVPSGDWVKHYGPLLRW